MYKPLKPRPFDIAESKSPNPGRPLEPRRPRRENLATRACLLCRKKRRKCDVERYSRGSCSSCRREGAECIVDAQADLRAGRYRQETKKDQRLLHKLLDSLQSTSEAEYLLELIRKQASTTDLEAHIDRLKQLSSDREAQVTTGYAQSKDDLTTVTGDGTPSLRSKLRAKTLQGVYQSERAEAGSTPEVLSFSDGLLSSRTESAQQVQITEDEEAAIAAGLIPRSANGAHVLSPTAREEGRRYLVPGSVRSFGNLAMSSAIRANGYPSYIQCRQLDVISNPFETCTPINVDASTTGIADVMASAIMSFRDMARSQIAWGVPARTVLSMDGIDVDLFFRDRIPSDPHTISTWACEFAKSWSFMPLLIRFVAIHYTATFVRWLTMPCRETYRTMSPLVRPVPSQLMIPHTADIDLCHIPFIRDYQLIHGGRWVDKITGESQRLHWPYGEDAIVEEILVERPPTASDTANQTSSSTHVKVKRLSPVFTRFIDDEQNWSIHRAMLQEIPELRGRVRLYDD